MRTGYVKRNYFPPAMPPRCIARCIARVRLGTPEAIVSRVRGETWELRRYDE
ncbi:hypothetical protein WN48_09676 [Eufriesea mexicana]|uniref:Uncharacterized protein n=1 Tax=Eufriesea mexicana TaxID=516756 RepID=A0A310S710_9HYME|nr:hypothetical protein WN48_09676 [Eufriesea mexicana]